MQTQRRREPRSRRGIYDCESRRGICSGAVPSSQPSALDSDFIYDSFKPSSEVVARRRRCSAGAKNAGGAQAVQRRRVRCSAGAKNAILTTTFHY